MLYLRIIFFLSESLALRLRP